MNDIYTDDLIYISKSGWCRLYNCLTEQSFEQLRSLQIEKLSLEVGNWEDLGLLTKLNGSFKKLVINKVRVDWCSISKLDELEELYLTDYLKNKVDFSNFKNLKSLWIDGREENIEQIYTIKTLESVRLANYKEVNLSKLEKLHNLVTLELVDSKKLSSLEGIECFTKLQKLNLVCCTKLVDVDGVKSLSKLKMLRIDSCKKVRLTDDFSTLKNLKYLGVFRQKEIVSLLPFKDCRSLEILLVADLKVTDGKVQFIKELPNLKKLIFQHKKHYDENLTSFKRELLEKFGDYEIIEKHFSMV
ncbi:hypothetical protein AAEU29_12635 [Pseudoalteromonas sp. SSM20]|uniref:hypothetical protein n=1 Tax=Pseudoalteromonas sp. SSM20 TaxID=3139394 RepID=UPI003BAAF2A5